MTRATTMLIPVLAFGAVATLAAILILQVVWRPWSGPDRSWSTHLNLGTALPEGYTRTVGAYVGERGLLAAWGLKSADVVTPEQIGRALFIGYGCASCHGLDGRGAFFASDLTTARVSKFTERIRNGMGPMPAFSEADLDEEKLQEIIAYLRTLRK